MAEVERMTEDISMNEIISMNETIRPSFTIEDTVNYAPGSIHNKLRFDVTFEKVTLECPYVEEVDKKGDIEVLYMTAWHEGYSYLMFNSSTDSPETVKCLIQALLNNTVGAKFADADRNSIKLCFMVKDKHITLKFKNYDRDTNEKLKQLYQERLIDRSINRIKELELENERLRKQIKENEVVYAD